MTAIHSSVCDRVTAPAPPAGPRNAARQWGAHLEAGPACPLENSKAGWDEAVKPKPEASSWRWAEGTGPRGAQRPRVCGACGRAPLPSRSRAGSRCGAILISATHQLGLELPNKDFLVVTGPRGRRFVPRCNLLLFYYFFFFLGKTPAVAPVFFSSRGEVLLRVHLSIAITGTLALVCFSLSPLPRGVPQ